MSLEMGVQVRRGAQVLRILEDWPVRKLADGTACIAYQRRIFPLWSPGFVDLDGDTYTKADCSGHVAWDEAPNLLEEERADAPYFLERVGGRSYFAFSGEPECAIKLEREFASRGVSRGLGESFRKAKNGVFYDWFIRLSGNADESLVESVIQDTSPGPVAPAQPEATMRTEGDGKLLQLLLDRTGLDLPGWIDDVAATKREIGAIGTERDALRRKFEALDGEAQRLRAENQRIRADLVRARSDARRGERRTSGLARRITQLRFQLVGNRTHPDRDLKQYCALLERDVDQLGNELEAATRERDTRADEAEEERGRSALLRSQLEARDRELSEPIPSERPKVRSNRAARLFEAVQETFLKRIDLDHEDVETLLERFGDATNALGVLKALNDKDERLRAKSFTSIGGVSEVPKVNTGCKGGESRGRIYYKEQDGDLKVAIHWKVDDKEQIRLVRRRLS